jgi:hypothetical protein
MSTATAERRRSQPCRPPFVEGAKIRAAKVRFGDR